MSNHHSDSTFHPNDELAIDAFRSVDLSVPVPSNESSYVAQRLDWEPHQPSHLSPRLNQPHPPGFQNLLVACLSLAAKMEELYIPLLVELQILESACIFEAEPIQRMELLVLSKLEWSLRAVTPFDYLYYFISIRQSSASNSDSLSTTTASLPV